MVSTASWFEQGFAGAQVMAILRGMGVERSAGLATTAWDLGIDLVEVPLQTPQDERALHEVARLAEERGKSVGAGTIISAEQIPLAQRAGARYLVSPGLDEALVLAAQDHGIPILPGVTTPSEVQAACRLGLRWLKAFPATWLGVEWFRHMRGPFPGLRFVATGGIDARNAARYLEAGASVVAIGSALQDPAQLEELAVILRRGQRASAGPP
jgi:Entner-Doudoroff aldolase